MANYPIIDKNGLVINVADWDGVTPWTPPDDCKAILDPTNQVWMGWTYANGTFTAPPKPPVVEPSPTPPPLTTESLAAVLVNAGVIPSTALSPTSVQTAIAAQPAIASITN